MKAILYLFICILFFFNSTPFCNGQQVKALKTNPKADTIKKSKSNFNSKVKQKDWIFLSKDSVKSISRFLHVEESGLYKAPLVLLSVAGDDVSKSAFEALSGLYLSQKSGIRSKVIYSVDGKEKIAIAINSASGLDKFLGFDGLGELKINVFIFGEQSKSKNDLIGNPVQNLKGVVKLLPNQNTAIMPGESGPEIEETIAAPPN